MLFNLHLWSLLLGLSLASACGIRAIVPVMLVLFMASTGLPETEVPRFLLMIPALNQLMFPGLTLLLLLDLCAPHIRVTRHYYSIIQTPLKILCSTFVLSCFTASLDPVVRFSLSLFVGGGYAFLIHTIIRGLEHESSHWHRSQILLSLTAVVFSVCASVFPLISGIGVSLFLLFGAFHAPRFIQRHF